MKARYAVNPGILGPTMQPADGGGMGGLQAAAVGGNLAGEAIQGH